MYVWHAFVKVWMLVLHKHCKKYQKIGFLWLVFSRISTKSKNLSFYGKIRIKENPYSGIFYAAKLRSLSFSSHYIKCSSISFKIFFFLEYGCKRSRGFSYGHNSVETFIFLFSNVWNIFQILFPFGMTVFNSDKMWALALVSVLL